MNVIHNNISPIYIYDLFYRQQYLYIQSQISDKIQSQNKHASIIACYYNNLIWLHMCNIYGCPIDRFDIMYLYLGDNLFMIQYIVEQYYQDLNIEYNINHMSDKIQEWFHLN